MDKQLTIKDFEDMFGVDELPKSCIDMVYEYDFRYRFLEGKERDDTILRVTRDIDNDTRIAGEHRKSEWEIGWSENKVLFDKTKDVKSLTPKYVRKGNPLRFRQDYIVPVENDSFELDFQRVFHRLVYETYFSQYQNIYEFGCGTGHNLVDLAQLYPYKNLYGFDWVQPSIDMVNEVASFYKYNIEGRIFDFFHIDNTLKIKPNSVVCTFGALEQTGNRYYDFIDYLVEQKPELCVFVEPMIEFYDTNKLVDYLGYRFLEKRKYWSGFVKLANLLEKSGIIKIVNKKRTGFGSLFVEGYNLFAWKVL